MKHDTLVLLIKYHPLPNVTAWLIEILKLIEYLKVKTKKIDDNVDS